MVRGLFIIFILPSFGFSQGKWVEQKNPFSGDEHYTYSDVCFLDSLTGYVLAGGLVLKTMDGGETWEVQDLPIALAGDGVCFLNQPLAGGIDFVNSL